MQPTLARRSNRALGALTVAAIVAACGGGGDAGTSDPADALYGQALQRWNEAQRTLADARALDPARSSVPARSLVATAETEFGAARALFDQVAATYPASRWYDSAGYFGGRCSYEIGVVDPATVPTSFADARDRLAAVDDRPVSAVTANAEYFEGRSRFQLAALTPPLDTYAAARTHFVRSLALAPSGTFADNAQYYLGRTWFEEGFRLANVTPSLTPADADYAPARNDLDQAELELAKVLASSTYHDNAQYYLGVSFSMEPEVDPAIRIANLEAAVSAFGTALSVTTSGLVAAGAHYWRGKAHYDLAFQLAPGAFKDQTEVSSAIADFKAVSPPSVHADNALYWLAKSYIWFDPAGAATAPFCTGGTGTAPADACAACAALTSLVSATNSPYLASPYPGRCTTYVTANGCTCP